MRPAHADSDIAPLRQRNLELLPPDPPITVLFVTDRVGASSAFPADMGPAGNRRYRAVGWCESISAATEAVERLAPDALVAEVTTLERVRALADLVETGVPERTVVVSGLPAELVFVPCLAAGVRGFLSQPVAPGLLSRAVSSVVVGQTYVDPRTTGLLVQLALHGRFATDEAGLTLRQAQVVHLVQTGLTNRRIADVLGLSPATVKTHLRVAMQRLGVHDRRDAVARMTGRRA